MIAIQYESGAQIENIEDLLTDESSLTSPSSRFQRLAHYYDGSASHYLKETSHTPDTYFFTGIGAQNFAVIEDKTNQKKGFQIFFREIVDGQEVGKLINLGSAVQFAGILLSQATRHDILHEATLNDLEDNKVVPHTIDVKVGEYTFQFSNVDASNATQWYEATFIKIMQTMYSDIFDDTVDPRSIKSVIISTIRKFFTGDGELSLPFLGKKPYTFEQAVSLLNKIDAFALNKALSANETIVLPQVEHANSSELSSAVKTEVSASTADKIATSAKSDESPEFIVEDLSPETISKYSALIENLVKHELNLATSSRLTKALHRRRVSKSQSMIKNFKEQINLTSEESNQDASKNFEAITKLHVLCRELLTRYGRLKLIDRFDRNDNWFYYVTNLIWSYEIAVARQLLERKTPTTFASDVAFISSLTEGSLIARIRGQEIDSYIVNLLYFSLPYVRADDTAAQSKHATKNSALLHSLISNLKENFTEGEEITGEAVNIVNVVIILSKIFTYSEDVYDLPTRYFLIDRKMPLLANDSQLLSLIKEFSKMQPTSYGTRRPNPDLGSTYMPDSRIMPRITSISEVES